MRGSGLPVYRGYSSQYGAGLGNVLGGLLRVAVPRLLKKAIPLLTPMVKSGVHRLLDQGINTLSTRLTGIPSSQPQAPSAPRKAPVKRPVKRPLPGAKRSLPNKRARRRKLKRVPRDALS